MANGKDLIVGWLKDAYAMETALVPILNNHARDAETHPSIRSRIERHVEETRHHADLVKGCLVRLGEEPSVAKTVFGGLFGAMQAPATEGFGDEEVKNGLMDFAAENFDVAVYQALIAAAWQVGDGETARACEDILRDEEQMASFLEENLPTVVRDALGGAA